MIFQYNYLNIKMVFIFFTLISISADDNPNKEEVIKFGITCLCKKNIKNFKEKRFIESGYYVYSKENHYIINDFIQKKEGIIEINNSFDNYLLIARKLSINFKNYTDSCNENYKEYLDYISILKILESDITTLLQQRNLANNEQSYIFFQFFLKKIKTLEELCDLFLKYENNKKFKDLPLGKINTFTNINDLSPIFKLYIEIFILVYSKIYFTTCNALYKDDSEIERISFIQKELEKKIQHFNKKKMPNPDDDDNISKIQKEVEELINLKYEDLFSNNNANSMN